MSSVVFSLKLDWEGGLLSFRIRLTVIGYTWAWKYSPVAVST